MSCRTAKLAFGIPLAGLIGLLLWYLRAFPVIARPDGNSVISALHIHNFTLPKTEDNDTAVAPWKDKMASSPYKAVVMPICHTDNSFNQTMSSTTASKPLIIGASSFIGASIVRVFHQLSIPVVASEDNVNIGFDPLAWYRWEKLIGMGLSPQFINYSNHDMASSFIKKHSPTSIIYIPMLLFEGEEPENYIRKGTELHENFLQLLEIVRKQSPSTSITLISISQPTKAYELLIKLFELSLSVYNRLYNMNIAIIRTAGVYGPWQRGYPDDLVCFVDDLAMKISQRLKASHLKECALEKLPEFTESLPNVVKGKANTDKWIEEYDTYTKAQTKGVIASTYITSRRNAQYALDFINNNYFFMENWFKNIYKMNLNMAVFHDDLSDKFVTTFKDNYPKADFVKITDFKNLSPNDRRYSAFYDYIIEHPEIKYFIMTDMRDLIVQNNPFEVLQIVGNYMYVGIDEPSRHLPKFSYLPKLFGKCFLPFKHRLSYQKELEMLGFFNAGAIGGSREVILAFLVRFSQHLDISSKLNCNMGIVQYIFHKFFYDSIAYGWPFNAGFLTHQPNIPGLAILHKWSMDSYN